MKRSPVCPGPKTMFLYLQGRVIHAVRRVVQFWRIKLNIFISADVLSVNLLFSVRES